MRAAWLGGSGGLEGLEFRTVPRPSPGPHEIRVRVHASAINRADLLQRRGLYPAPPGWPSQIPGLEYAGVVEALGPASARWRVGDRVMGLVGGGAQAEAVVVHEDEAMPTPRALSDAQAAAIPEAFLTAWDALVHRARVAPGERVLVHAVGSGVGTAAVQLAPLLQVHLIGTSRTLAKLDRLQNMGLAEAIDTSVAPFGQQLAEPVHAIIDSLGGPALAENLSALHRGGRLVVLGLLQGGQGAVDLGLVLRQRLTIVGTAMRSREHPERVALVQEFTERVLPRFALPGTPGLPRLAPVVDAVLPMDELARAHELMESNTTFGKIVVCW
jgi:NADPH:quinone reductase-like Zn-dependent oxidoreductase